MFTCEAEVNAAVSALKDALHLENISKIYAYPFDGDSSYLDLADFVAVVDSTREQGHHPDDPKSSHPALISSVLLQLVVARLSATQYPVEDRTIMRDLCTLSIVWWLNAEICVSSVFLTQLSLKSAALSFSLI
jgi:hypothetical protein